MAWVTGIKQAQMIQPEAEREGEGRQAMGRQATPEPVRVITELPSIAWAGAIRRGPMIFLPVHTGAGPCGTHARGARGRAPVIFRGVPIYGLYCSPLAWSIRHLIAPLQAYYAEQNRPRDPLSRAGITIGVRHGGGNGRAQLL